MSSENSTLNECQTEQVKEICSEETAQVDQMREKQEQQSENINEKYSELEDNQDNDFELNNNAETLQQIDKLQNVMNKALQIVGLYKNEIDELRLRIGDMKEVISLREVEDKQRVVPIVNKLSQIYREEFSKLIDQNRLLESELIITIQEKQEVVQQIYSCVDKIKILEQQVFKGEIPPYLKKKLQEQREHQQKILERLKEQSSGTIEEKQEVSNQSEN